MTTTPHNPLLLWIAGGTLLAAAFLLLDHRSVLERIRPPGRIFFGRRDRGMG